MKPLEGTKQKRSLLTVKGSQKSKTKTFVILGVERGGTSMVAGMVRALGIDLGERAGRNHEDPKFLTDDQEKLAAQIEEYNAKKSVWGFKVPKASLMLDFYDKHLRNPHYILVFRNIESTVDSWCSRGTNDPMDSARHAISYYDSALKYFKQNKRPLIFANYERACENPEEFADELAKFIGLEASQGDIKRAASIVTGEGGGYLDLPEYYFHIDSLEFKEWPVDTLRFELPDSSKQHMAIADKKVGDRVVLYPENEFFPRDFYLGFDLSLESNSLLAEQGLRVYMDFTDEFFPGHAYRPPLKSGKNLLKISTNGNVKRIALGSLRAGYKFGFRDVELFGSDQSELLGNYQIIPPNRSVAPSPLKRVIKKLSKRISRDKTLGTQ